MLIRLNVFRRLKWHYENSALSCAAGPTLVACVGALVGLSIGIWASVEYLEPAFDATTGINDKGAKALTALVDIAGGLESAALGGVIIFSVAASFLACCSQLCSQRSSASTPRYSATPSPSLFQRAATTVTTRDAAYTASISMV